jgi:methionyl-tRNA synthetase
MNFLNLENDKISTSKNWAGWLHEYLQEFPNQQDVLRYVLTAISPETKDNDFTWKDFQTRSNSELLAIFGNFVNRTIVLIDKYYEGKVPECSELTTLDQEIIEEIKAIPQKVATSIEHYKFREALAEMMNLARVGNKYLTETEPWKLQKTEPERVKTILNLSLQICANLAIVGEPFLPFTAEKINTMLNLSAQKWAEAGRVDLVPNEHQINKAEHLFSKIEDEQIAVQMQKLEATKNRV